VKVIWSGWITTS